MLANRVRMASRRILSSLLSGANFLVGKTVNESNGTLSDIGSDTTVNQVEISSGTTYVFKTGTGESLLWPKYSLFDKDRVYITGDYVSGYTTELVIKTTPESKYISMSSNHIDGASSDTWKLLEVAK